MDASLKNQVRLFVAIPVSSFLAEDFHLIQKQNRLLSGIRWTPDPNLHITIFFLGEVMESNCQDIKKAISIVTDNAIPLQLEFEKITVAGKKKTGRMIWAQFKKNISFTLLSKNIYESVKPFLLVHRVVDDPVPHITLARMKTEPEKIQLDLENKISFPKTTFCELWKTVQTKNGVVYESLEQFMLKNCY